jgi:hypothetical protein
MLPSEAGVRVGQISEAMKGYVGRVLHTDMALHAMSGQGSIPSYLTHAYDLKEGQIGGRPVIIMERKAPDGTPAEMAKHVSFVQAKRPEPVILVLPWISASHRSRLVDLGVSFIVPDSQLYLPTLAMDLFYHLLNADEKGLTSSEIAERLHYTPMSIGRALDELTGYELASTEKVGRERQISFDKPHSVLFEQAREKLRNPVRRVVPIDRDADDYGFKITGEAALSRLTSLSYDGPVIYACTGDQWKALQARVPVKQVPVYDAQTILEIWSYDPASLATGWTVDPLSLYAQFWKDKDERVAMAADDILGTVQW